MRQELHRQISIDLHNEDGLIAVMGEHGDKVNDIPAYQEQVQYLQQAMESWPIEESNGQIDSVAGNKVLVNQNRILVLTEYCHAENPYAFFWLTQTFPNVLHHESGCLILMYSIEEVDGKSHIFPEWFTLFAFEAGRTTYYSQLAFHSVLKHPEFENTDWNEAALRRAMDYGLPTQQQLARLKQSRGLFASHRK